MDMNMKGELKTATDAQTSVSPLHGSFHPIRSTICRIFLGLVFLVLAPQTTFARWDLFLLPTHMFLGTGATSEGIPMQSIGYGHDHPLFRSDNVFATYEYGYSAPFFKEGKGYMWVSGNGSYHLPSLGRGSNWTPFVTGGYTLRFWDKTRSMFNFGGGVRYQLSDDLILGMELRDQVLPSPDPVHHFQFRLSFIID